MSRESKSLPRLLIETDLGSQAWIKVGGRLVRGLDQNSQSEQTSVQRDMDAQYTMVSLRDAILGLGRELMGTSPTNTDLGTTHMILSHLHHHHHHGLAIQLDYRRMRSLHVTDGVMSWDGYDDLPVATLPIEFRMLDIERCTGIECPCIHLQLYSAVMRGHRLDETQMIMLFPLSLSVDVSRRELEAVKQRPDKTVTSFISCWREKIAQIIDRPSERDQISMIMHNLQPHYALYGIEEGISRGLWKLGLGPEPLDVSTIGTMGYSRALSTSIAITSICYRASRGHPCSSIGIEHHVGRGQLDSSHSLGCH
ncbi:hypothetical protein AAG906_032079 [Vitis piasezkii]